MLSLLTFSSCRLFSGDSQPEAEPSCHRIEGLLCSDRVQSIQAAGSARLTTERADGISLKKRSGAKMIVRAAMALPAVRFRRVLANRAFTGRLGVDRVFMTRGRGMVVFGEGEEGRCAPTTRSSLVTPKPSCIAWDALKMCTQDVCS